LPWNIIITLHWLRIGGAVFVLIERGANWLIHTLVGWILSAVALYLVAHIVEGIELRDFGAALIATIVIAAANNTAGPVLRFLAWPITFLTLGLFLLVINAILLKLASMFTPGFRVRGFGSALLGSLALTVISAILRYLV
jgi:putative membrane protein